MHHCEATSCSFFSKLAGTTLIGPIALQPPEQTLSIGPSRDGSRSSLQLRLDAGDSHLTADGGDLPAAGLGTLVHGGELPLVVHLQQLQSPGAVAHLGGTGVWTGYIKLRQIHFKRDEIKVVKLLPLGSLG